MRFIGFSFKYISIEKVKESKGNINVNTDMKIKDLKKSSSDLFKEKDTFLVEYEFNIEYQPNFANVLFKGNLIFLLDGKEDEELVKGYLEGWKEKKLPEEFSRSILQIVFNKCNLKALQLEEYLNLPSHIPGPVFQNLNKDNRKK